jgi:hypothetical protein
MNISNDPVNPLREIYFRGQRLNKFDAVRKPVVRRRFARKLNYIVRLDRVNLGRAGAARKE